jgi:hypothetical protein
LEGLENPISPIYGKGEMLRILTLGPACERVNLDQRDRLSSPNGWPNFAALKITCFSAISGRELGPTFIVHKNLQRNLPCLQHPQPKTTKTRHPPCQAERRRKENGNTSAGSSK